tara:strand:+ start:434 stop:688 length:255 start_codon:yes stop_codon:yes gene_type:complete
MKQNKLPKNDLLGIVDGDLVEIHESFESMAKCKYALVVRAYWTNPAPSTHLKRTMLEVLKQDGTISKIPLSFIKNVYKKDDQCI